MRTSRVEAFSDGVLAIIIAALWVIPDRRIEAVIATSPAPGAESGTTRSN